MRATLMNVSYQTHLTRTLLVSVGPTTIQLSDLQNFLSGLNVPAGETTNQRSGTNTIFG
jgi:hypothetical protein